MPVTTRISENEVYHSSTDRRPRTANPGPSLYNKPVWNRRKEILLGTPDKVNPAKTIARRIRKIHQLLAQHGKGDTDSTLFYDLLLDEINSNGTTRFFLNDAAAHIGVSPRTLDRQVAKCKRLGFLKVTQLPKQGGFLGYAEYELLPINKIINDDGHESGRKQWRRSLCGVTGGVICGVTGGVTERANKKQPVSPSVQPSLPNPNPSGSENAEAGRTATAPASFGASQGSDTRQESQETTQTTRNLKSEITAWSKQHLEYLMRYGFKKRDHISLRNDILNYITVNGEHDPEKWDLFTGDVWPRLQITIPGTASFLSRTNLGPGWLFRPSKETNQPNFAEILFSTRYRENDFTLPPDLFSIGSVCFDKDRRQNVTVAGYTHQSYLVRPGGSDSEYGVNVWRVGPAIVTVEVAPSDPSVPLDAPSEPVVVASLATSEPRDDSEAAPTPSEPSETKEVTDELTAWIMDALAAV